MKIALRVWGDERGWAAGGTGGGKGGVGMRATMERPRQRMKGGGAGRNERREKAAPEGSLKEPWKGDLPPIMGGRA